MIPNYQTTNLPTYQPTNLPTYIYIYIYFLCMHNTLVHAQECCVAVGALAEPKNGVPETISNNCIFMWTDMLRRIFKCSGTSGL